MACNNAGGKTISEVTMTMTCWTPDCPGSVTLSIGGTTTGCRVCGAAYRMENGDVLPFWKTQTVRIERKAHNNKEH